MKIPMRVSPRDSCTAAGFTLVELLVAITLGLLLTGAITAIFLASSQSFRTGEGVAQVQEEGRFASLLIAPVVRQAGYLPEPIFAQPDPTAIFSPGLSKYAIYGIEQGGAVPAAYTGLPATASAIGDVIIVAFVGRNPAVPADTPLRTCLGQTVDATQMAVNIFFLTPGPVAGDASSLNCYTNISLIGDALNVATNTIRNEPLIVGVSDMQIRYGVAVGSDLNVNRYFTATGVAASDWVNVSSVQMTFTIDSAAQVERARPDTTGAGLANGVNNGRIRRTFNTTIQIRNRLRP